jgi:hypothetical protein
MREIYTDELAGELVRRVVQRAVMFPAGKPAG